MSALKVQAVLWATHRPPCRGGQASRRGTSHGYIRAIQRAGY